MKRKTVFLSAMLFLGMQAYALDFTVGNFNYSTDSDTTVILMGYVTTPTGELTIPAVVANGEVNYSVTSIERKAFSDCRGLTGSLTIPNSIKTIGNQAFSNCVGFKGSLTISESVESIGEYAFSDCVGLTGSLTIPSSVKTIGQYAFLGCYGLTGSLTISSSVTAIENNVFASCRGLTGSLIIPSSVETIGEGAFSSCRGLTGPLAIPDLVTTIATQAFFGCSGLTGQLTIPALVRTIGNGAFASCSGLKTVVSHRSTPPSASDAFDYNAQRSVLKVPQGSLGLYKAAGGWRDFGTFEEFAPTSISEVEEEFKAFWIEGNRLCLSDSEAVERVELYNASGALVGRTMELPDSYQGALLVKLFYKDGTVKSGKTNCR